MQNRVTLFGVLQRKSKQKTNLASISMSNPENSQNLSFTAAP